MVLAWDTCTGRATMAVGRGGDVWAETRFRTEKGHSGWLMPLVEITLARLSLHPGEVGVVAAGVGPGTFSGVKVGVATAKAIAVALEVGMIAMPTLELIAREGTEGSDLVIPVLDARRGLWYTAFYRRGVDGLRLDGDYSLMKEEQIARVALSLGYERLSLCGEAPPALLELLEKGDGEVSVRAKRHPNSAEMMSLSREMLEAGMVKDPVEVNPIYLKRPV